MAAGRFHLPSVHWRPDGSPDRSMFRQSKGTIKFHARIIHEKSGGWKSGQGGNFFVEKFVAMAGSLAETLRKDKVCRHGVGVKIFGQDRRDNLLSRQESHESKWFGPKKIGDEFDMRLCSLPGG